MRGTGRIALTAVTAGMALAAALQASAQQVPPSIPDDVVRRALEFGLQNIHRAVCDGFNTCAPTTPDELENPPITLEHARSALLAGTRTALAQWCGLDGNRRSVLPMTRQLRKLRFDNRQVALMAVIHGFQQGVTAEQLKASGTCDAATRSKLDAQLPKS
jgi:hypothetical protein